MSYEVMRDVLAGIGIAGLVTAAVLFFTLHIPAVFGELTGRTARRAIAENTEKNAAKGRGSSRGQTEALQAAGRFKSGSSAFEEPEATLPLSFSEEDFRIVTDILVVHTSEDI